MVNALAKNVKVSNQAYILVLRKRVYEFDLKTGWQIGPDENNNNIFF